MKEKRPSMRFPVAILLTLSVCGCVTQDDLSSDLQRAGQPCSDSLQETQFALIGQIVAPEGTFHVALQRLVVTGMLAPRGQTRLVLLDTRRRPVANYHLATAQP